MLTGEVKISHQQRQISGEPYRSDESWFIQDMMLKRKHGLAVLSMASLCFWYRNGQALFLVYALAKAL
jgi:hypothetical protein